MSVSRDWCFVTAAAIAEAVLAEKVSPVDIVSAYLERIDQADPLLNAYVALRRDEAREEARAIEKRIASGAAAGPLAGVPVGVKDVEDVAGLPTTYGSIPFAGNIATEDSTHVRRLREAGAIILGKTNTPEFAYAGFTKNLLFGITRNPWDVRLTPGGSSGGSAAAVAGGIAALGTGTDRGGSIRIPASYTGTFGLKPTFGRVPRGPSPMLDWSDTDSVGCLARSTRDLAIYLDVARGYHPSDPDSLPAPDVRYAEVLEGLPTGLRLGFSKTLGYARVDADVLHVCRQALPAFEAFARVEDADLELPDVAKDWLTVGAPERYAHLKEVIARNEAAMGRAFVQRVRAGARVTAERYGEAQRVRSQLHRALAESFERYDVLITPATATTAFDARGRLPKTVGGVPLGDPLEVTPFTYPFNLSGHPAMSVPVGVTPEGRPVGLQLVAPKYREDILLQVAWAYERAIPPLGWPQEIAAMDTTGN